MERLERILSRPVAKPYRSHAIHSTQDVTLNKDGHLDFAPGDIENPKNWSKARRWYITSVAVLLVVNATFASSSPSGCLKGIAKEFDISLEVAGLVVTLFLLGYCFGPLFWAPLSEYYGRRWIFYISFPLYLVFNFLCAFAKNFPALLIGRFLTGTFASSPLSNSAGVLADIWGPVERGNAMAAFSVMTFVGPALGPVISGFLELKEDWRWNFYVLLWLAGITSIFMFTLPETLPQVVLLNKARRIRKLKTPGHEDLKAPIEGTDQKLSSIFRVALTRPWKIMIDPISFLIAIYLSTVYTLLYMLFSIYPIVFQEKRGWNSGVGELPLIGTIVGAVTGGIIIFFYSSHQQKTMLAGQKGRPEDRLPIAMAGGILFPITMFWFAWTAEYNSIHWIVPTIAGTFLSTSIVLVFVAYFNYLADTYLMYTASAIAANTIARSACGAAAPLFTNYMFSALGIAGGGSLIGGVAVLLSPIPFIFYRYGEGIRKRSKFAPTPEANAKSPEVQQNDILSSSSTDIGAASDSNRHSENGDMKEYVALKPGAASRQDNDRASVAEQLRGPRNSSDIDVEKGEQPNLKYTT
ncbi:MFS multidrug transporter-like protein [Venustampulla echinocandica]|uniref:MFS multidrug transporter-like protein n=1 Tax=Venustampulla echinocandica TaxID=2656787 RepID=A0A370TR32_9HELO|nr:MFS multidrug transporter-like protein [Venustampulla echinocandica]RDL37995.1 MFS multidrug transporter-like protein [Venustampulla echinocandica]